MAIELVRTRRIFGLQIIIIQLNFPLFGYPVDSRLISAFNKEVQVFQKAALLFKPPIEIIEIPCRVMLVLQLFTRMVMIRIYKKCILHMRTQL